MALTILHQFILILVAASCIAIPHKRSLVIISDDNSFVSTIDESELAIAARVCNDMINLATIALNNDADSNLLYVFGDMSDATRNTVRMRLYQILAGCATNRSPSVYGFTNPTVFQGYNQGSTAQPCVSPSGDAASLNAWTLGDNVIVFCNTFYVLPSAPTSCWMPSQGGWLLNALAHQFELMNSGPGDWYDWAYGQNVLQLPTSLRLTTPDAYVFYATNAALNCSYGQLTQDPPPTLPTPLY